MYSGSTCTCIVRWSLQGNACITEPIFAIQDFKTNHVLFLPIDTFRTLEDSKMLHNIMYEHIITRMLHERALSIQEGTQHHIWP